MSAVSNDPVYCGQLPPMLFESVPWIYNGTRRVVTKCVEIGSLVTITAGWTMLAWTMMGFILAPVSILFTPVTVGSGVFLTWAGSLVNRNVVQLKQGELYDKLERCFAVAYFLNLISIPLLLFCYAKYQEPAFGYLSVFNIFNVAGMVFSWGTALGMTQRDAVRRRGDQDCFCVGCILRTITL